MYLSGTVTMVDKNNRTLSGTFYKELPLSPVRIVISEQQVLLGDILSNIRYITFTYTDTIRKVVNVVISSNVVVVKDKSDLYGLNRDILEDMYQLCNQSMDSKVAGWIEQLR